MLLYDQQLLIILLAKDGDVRLDEVEEDIDDRCHAAEKLWAKSATQNGAELWDLDTRRTLGSIGVEVGRPWVEKARSAPASASMREIAAPVCADSSRNLHPPRTETGLQKC